MRINKRIYLDYAATTPVDPRVVKEMLPYFTKKFGNSVSLHWFGQETSKALEKNRKIVADFIFANPKEIIFTSSASESNNLALKGIAFANKHKGNNIIISEIEHDCILESSRWLTKQGFTVTKLPVDKYGLINPDNLRKAINNNTILVSIGHANNEIGTIEPIKEIGQICHQKGVYFHTDASQSFGKIPLNVLRMNIDLLTASSHKIYGPKGAALLFVKKGVLIEPIIHGGGHENNLRSSTINVPAIVGFAKAVEICQKDMNNEGKRLTKLRDKLTEAILTTIPNSYLNGHPKTRLPNIVNVYFSFVEGEAIIMELDFYGIAASTASACASAKLAPSHVLLALGLKPEQAHGSLRLSLGRFTSNEEINYVIKILPKIIEKLRRISPFKRE